GLPAKDGRQRGDEVPAVGGEGARLPLPRPRSGVRYGVKSPAIRTHQPDVAPSVRRLVRSECDPATVRRIVGRGSVQPPRRDAPRAGAIEANREDRLTTTGVAEALER